MGIREAIEWHAAHTLLENGRDQGVFDKTITKVLSILDEHLGECVGEGELDYGMLSSLHLKSGDEWENLSDALHGRVKSGDHIFIYVRRR